MTAKTPWRPAGYHFIRDADEKLVLNHSGAPLSTKNRDLIIAAVNLYSSLPEDVRRLKGETIAKCVEAVNARRLWVKTGDDDHLPSLCVFERDAIAALEAEETAQ